MTLLNQNSKFNSQSQNSKEKAGLRECSYGFSIKAIKFIENLPERRTTLSEPERRTYRILSDQLLRSATSIGANIFEAKSASSKRDFIKYYEIALKSANETTYWLGLLRDALGLNVTALKDLSLEADELSRMLAASLLTMKDKR